MTSLKSIAAGLVTIALTCCFAAQAGPVPPTEIAGINLKMEKDEVMRRLSALGKFVRREGADQEVWEVKDPHYSHLIVGFGEKEKLRFLTAVARTDDKAGQVSYSDIGDLGKARQLGDPKIKNFQYEWTLPKTKDQPRLVVLAMGRDEKLLTTLTLRNPEVEREKEDD